MSTKLNLNLGGAAMSHVPSNRNRTPEFKILCASRDAEALACVDDLSAALPMAEIHKRILVNGDTNLLFGLDLVPDLVVFFQGKRWTTELEEYGRQSQLMRPPLVVVGKMDNPDALRAALKAGARDFLAENNEIENIAKTLKGILDEIVSEKQGQAGNLVALINAKGGCGASLLASNIACAAAELLHQKTVLLDLDIQFGHPGQYLDNTPQHGLLEALQMASSLDAVALEGYMIRHKSGLHVLSAEEQELFLPDDMSGQQFEHLLALLLGNYQQVIVDLPRHIDFMTSMLLERANRVVLVVQQNIVTLRDAARMMHILMVDLGIPSNRIHIIVNRYQSALEITVSDICRTLSCDQVTVVPNDFRTVSESLNRAEPLHDIAQGKPVTRAMYQLSENLTGSTLGHRPGLLGRLRSWL